MQELHANKILYRDLKPEVKLIIKNILINEDGYIKITDFGLSKMNETCLSMSGTPEYLSPEILAKIEHSYESDIWNLGCFIFEIVILINFSVLVTLHILMIVKANYFIIFKIRM